MNSIDTDANSTKPDLLIIIITIYFLMTSDKTLFFDLEGYLSFM